MLCCAQPCQCVLSQPVVNPHRVAPNRFDQHSSSVNTADFLKLLRTCQFLCVCVLRNRALATVLCTFCRPHHPKVLCGCQFFSGFEVQIELSPQSFALFVDNFPRSRPAPAETDALLQEPRYPKKTYGFAPESAFTREFTHASKLLHFPNTWRWVVDMMMSLTWWCEC